MRFALIIALAAHLASAQRSMNTNTKKELITLGRLHIRSSQQEDSVVSSEKTSINARGLRLGILGIGSRSLQKTQSVTTGNKFNNNATGEAIGNTTGSPVAAPTANPDSQPNDLSNFQLHGCESSTTAFDKYIIVASRDDMTLDECASLCGPNRALFATSKEDCFCGDAVDADFKAINPTACDSPCPGNSAQTCGGTPASSSSMNSAEDLPPKVLSVYTQKQRVHALNNDNVNNADATSDVNSNANANANSNDNADIVTITNTTKVVPLPLASNATATNRIVHAPRPPSPTKCSIGAICAGDPSTLSTSGVSRAQIGSLAILGLLSFFLQAVIS